MQKIIVEGRDAGAYAAVMEACAEYVAKVAPQLREPSAVADFARPLMLAHPGHEVFLTLSLDTRNRVTGAEVVGIGNLDSVNAGPREVFRSAVINAAANVILCHNHPSGDPTPSPDDVQYTRRLIEAGNILGIKVLDHVVVGVKTDTWPGYVSMREKGLCQFM